MQTYGLKLCGGQQWCLIDSTENIHWSREFIKSSGLQLCQDAYLPAIIIVGCSRNHRSVPEIINSLDCKISKFLPSSGWRLVERNMCRCWFHDRQLLFICELRDNKLGPREAKFLTFLALSNLLYPFYFYALSHGGLPLHAALIERHGQGFLLVADKNTGKSTCCRRIPKPWSALCDEEALVLRGQDGLYYAHPFINLTDFSSRGLKFTYDVQRCVPLAGIFFLRQGKLDLLEPIGKAEASVHLDKSSWDVFIRYKNHIGPLRQHRKMQLDSACGLAKSIPGFVLFATLDGRFWDEMGKALLFAEERR